jgi:hypothetical protein
MGHGESKRERRIRLTLTVAARRREQEERRSRGELPLGKFAKQTLGCDCRKRCHGRPRVAAGMCDIGERERIYEWRLEDRLLRDAVRSGRDLVEWAEPESRKWPSGRSGAPKGWVIEVRDLDRRGAALGGWAEHARYRTEAGRDAALRALRLNVSRYDVRWDTVPGQEVKSGGCSAPRREWRPRPPVGAL